MMGRRYLPRLLAALAALALLLIASGCGSSNAANTSASQSPGTPSGVSAEEIADASAAKMADVKSFSFVADAKLKMVGDASKVTDPTAAALFSETTTLHAEGGVSSEPEVVDMTVTAKVANQPWEFGLRAKGDKAWIQYKGQWYALDDENSTSSPSVNMNDALNPTEELEAMGLTPEEIGMTYELVGTEDVAGVATHHVRTTIDAQKAIPAMTKAAQDPDLAKTIGVEAATQIKQAYGQSATLFAKAERFDDPVIDMWIGVDDMLLYKQTAKVAANLTGAEGAEGVDSMSATWTLTMSDFGDPVTVTAPAKAHSMDKLMEQVLGGLTVGI